MLAHYFAINFVILHGLKIGISENNDLLKILASLREIWVLVMLTGVLRQAQD